MASNKHLLTINVGSASLKWRLVHATDLTMVVGGQIDRLRQKPSVSVWSNGVTEKTLQIPRGVQTPAQAFRFIIKALAAHGIGLSSVVTIGHRVVHGGPDFAGPTIISPRVLHQLRKLNQLAPLHNPHNLEGIIAAKRFFPRARQVAVFDTAYFADLPVWSGLYALPYQLTRKYQLRRYGFHGLSHQFVAEAAAEMLGRPLKQLSLVTCHLGSGASIAAISQGRPVDVSMGFTPLEGLVMNTRSGDIDPGLVLYLARHEKLTVDGLEQLLNQESGLKGISGFSDMRDILAAAGLPTTDRAKRHTYTARERQRARLAIEIYVYRIQKYIGAYATILGGCDAIVFTGGIAEQSLVIRQMISAGLRVWKNARTVTIPTDEEWMIARQARSVMTR